MSVDCVAVKIVESVQWTVQSTARRLRHVLPMCIYMCIFLCNVLACWYCICDDQTFLF